MSGSTVPSFLFLNLIQNLLLVRIISRFGTCKCLLSTAVSISSDKEGNVSPPPHIVNAAYDSIIYSF
jgi:hypothetical protein